MLIKWYDVGGEEVSTREKLARVFCFWGCLLGVGF